MKTPKPNIIKYTGKKTSFNHGCRMTLRMEKIDSRTKVGKTVQFLYDLLWDFVGEANTLSLMLIDSIVFKRMRMLFLETQHTNKPVKDFP